MNLYELNYDIINSQYNNIDYQEPLYDKADISIFENLCNNLINRCAEPENYSTTISTEKTTEVFRSFFPEKFNQSIDNLDKRTLKNKVEEIINSLDFQSIEYENYTYLRDNYINVLRLINQDPKLTEALFFSKNQKHQFTNIKTKHPIYFVYDRTQTRKLGIFKVCDPSSRSAITEVEITNYLSKFSHINQKKSCYIYSKIDNGEIVGGIFQKLVKGSTYSDYKEKIKDINHNLLNEKNVLQLHYIALFDLLNFNGDRHTDNLMVDDKGNFWAIDNECDDVCPWEKKAIDIIWHNREIRNVLNKPMSQEFRNHLLSLEAEKLLSSQLDPINREISESVYIPFLKLAAEQTPPPTLIQIYTLLEMAMEIASENEENPTDAIKQVIGYSLESKQFYLCMTSIFKAWVANQYPKYISEGIIKYLEKFLIKTENFFNIIDSYQGDDFNNLLIKLKKKLINLIELDKITLIEEYKYEEIISYLKDEIAELEEAKNYVIEKNFPTEILIKETVNHLTSDLTRIQKKSSIKEKDIEFGYNKVLASKRKSSSIIDKKGIKKRKKSIKLINNVHTLD